MNPRDFDAEYDAWCVTAVNAMYRDKIIAEMLQSVREPQPHPQGDHDPMT